MKTKYTRQLRIQDQNGLSDAKGCVAGRLLWGAECLLRSALGISVDGREGSELDWAEGEVQLGSRPRDSLGSPHGRSGIRKEMSWIEPSLLDLYTPAGIGGGYALHQKMGEYLKMHMEMLILNQNGMP